MPHVIEIISTRHHPILDGAILELADGRFVAAHPDRPDVPCRSLVNAACELSANPDTVDDAEVAGWFVAEAIADRAWSDDAGE